MRWLSFLSLPLSPFSSDIDAIATSKVPKSFFKKSRAALAERENACENISSGHSIHTTCSRSENAVEWKRRQDVLKHSRRHSKRERPARAYYLSRLSNFVHFD